MRKAWRFYAAMMTMIATVALFSGATVFPLAAQEIHGVEGPLEAYFNIEGAQCHCTLTREAVERGPDWSPGKPAPFKPGDAARLALDLVMKKMPSAAKAGWYVSDIKMMPLYGTGYRKWYYTINLLIADSPAKLQGNATIYIAMDGTPGEWQ